MDTIQNDSPGLIGLYRAFWRYAEGARLKVISSSALLVSSQLTKLAIPWLTAQAINAVQTSGSAGGQSAALLIVPIYLIYYVVQPMPGNLVVKQILFDGILLLVLGGIVAWLYRAPVRT